MNRKSRLEANQRTAERQERENSAPRLIREVPGIASLRLSMAEFRVDATEAFSRHTRHIVVARAPALFQFPCTEDCTDGGYDFTHEIMKALRGGSTDFHGHAECRGTRFQTTCRNRLEYAAFATYFAAPPDREGRSSAAPAGVESGIPASSK
jgi:hypothetical protein